MTRALNPFTCVSVPLREKPGILEFFHSMGKVMGVAPTGKTVNMALHEFHHLENGKLTHTWHLEDWFGMLNSIGAWPPVA